MRQTRSQTKNHWQSEFFREIKTELHAVVCLLLVRRFQKRKQREFTIVTAILLILRRMLRRVVGNYQHQTTIHARDCRVHKRVGAGVQSHVLHTDDGTFARIRHAKSGFVGRLFVAAPFRTDVLFARIFRFLDKFSYFSRRSSRICIHTRNSCVNSTEGNRFSPKQ